jgi:hypothetical protein
MLVPLIAYNMITVVIEFTIDEEPIGMERFSE